MLSISSPPTIEGNRVYVITNRSQVVCLDLNGHYDGNDSPKDSLDTYLKNLKKGPSGILRMPVFY